MEIRKATLLDISPILAMLSEMHSEPERALDPVDWVKVTETVTRCIAAGGVIVAVSDNNFIVGSIGGEAKAQWYSDVERLGDYWFYVLQDHRKSPAGFKLMKEFKKLAQSANMDLTVGHVLEYDMERMDKFYTKLGFERSGALFSLKEEK